ncbi:unnamed protein product [Heterobilharzia americana]|nr:unnamed protein product [Heterobilharzia americana]
MSSLTAIIWLSVHCVRCDETFILLMKTYSTFVFHIQPAVFTKECRVFADDSLASIQPALHFTSYACMYEVVLISPVFNLSYFP